MISVTVLTKNSARHLKRVLESLQDFEEIIILDTGSTDETVSIAGSFSNVRIYSAEFQGFGAAHNFASALAKNDWVLSIDSDEVLTKELTKEIHHQKLNDDSVYSFPRHTYYRGALVRCCGWYPDRITRLYNRKKTAFSDDAVHEKIVQKGLQEVKLFSPLLHYSYENISDFLEKMQHYSTLFALQNRGKKSSPGKAVRHAIGAFFKSYFLKRGFLGGYAGLLISTYNANTAFYKYLKLYELCDTSLPSHPEFWKT